METGSGRILKILNDKIKQKKIDNNKVDKNQSFQKILEDLKKLDSKKTKEAEKNPKLQKERLDKIMRIVSTYEAKDVFRMLKIKINIKDGKIDSEDDKYFKDDGSVDIKDMITRLGNNVSDKDLDEFAANVTSLWKSGDIDDDDYAYAMRWVLKRKQAAMLKSTVKKIENDGIDNIVDGSSIVKTK